MTKGIFASKADMIVNPVNCVGVMGKGLAKEFKERYPQNFKKYYAACMQGSFKIGDILLSKAHKNEQGWAPVIANFPTKNHWRQASSYDFIRASLPKLREAIEKSEVKSVAIPALGCGLGGLEWKNVRTLILDEMKDLSRACEIQLYDKELNLEVIKIEGQELQRTKSRSERLSELKTQTSKNKIIESLASRCSNKIITDSNELVKAIAAKESFKNIDFEGRLITKNLDRLKMAFAQHNASSKLKLDEKDLIKCFGEALLKAGKEMAHEIAEKSTLDKIQHTDRLALSIKKDLALHGLLALKNPFHHGKAACMKISEYSGLKLGSVVPAMERWDHKLHMIEKSKGRVLGEKWLSKMNDLAVHAIDPMPKEFYTDQLDIYNKSQLLHAATFKQLGPIDIVKTREAIEKTFLKWAESGLKIDGVACGPAMGQIIRAENVLGMKDPWLNFREFTHEEKATLNIDDPSSLYQGQREYKSDKFENYAKPSNPVSKLETRGPDSEKFQEQKKNLSNDFDLEF